VFFSVKELELKKVCFDVAFPPGEIDFSGDGLEQSTPLEAQGSAELLANTLGEIRIRGKLKVRMRCECDRCLEPAEFPIESNFDLFYRPEVEDEYDEEVAIDDGLEADIAPFNQVMHYLVRSQQASLRLFMVLYSLSVSCGIAG